jgi:phosphate/sulfate permease
MEGAKGVNFKVFGKQVMAWVGTLFIMGIGTAALFWVLIPVGLLGGGLLLKLLRN